MLVLVMCGKGIDVVARSMELFSSRTCLLQRSSSGISCVLCTTMEADIVGR